MFPTLIHAGCRADIFCAYSPSGAIIGATVAAAPSSSHPFHKLLAWPSTLGERCGAIACVGVATSSRRSGAGLGMVMAATQYLRNRGCDGVFM